MTDQRDVSVKLDDRIRLVSAVLAATNYPEKSQQRKPHGTHAHARATRKYLADYKSHPAAQATQHLLDQGTPLEALYALALLLDWPSLETVQLPPWVPDKYNQHLRDFYETTNLADWWERDKTAWDKSIKEADTVFGQVHFKSFLKPFLGEIRHNFVFIPNVGYPTDYEIGFSLGDTLYCVSPPPLAWGDSPPWPYDEPTMITHSYRTALSVYGRILLLTYLRENAEQLTEVIQTELPVSDQFKAQHPSWEDQFSTLFLSAVVAMYLEEHVDEREYRSYMLMEKKAHGMALLPGTVSVLRRYLQEVGSSDKYNNLVEFLPIFPRQLRVARKIVTF
jgi:hypothetical protein